MRRDQRVPPCQCVEEGGLAGVGQTDDAEAFHDPGQGRGCAPYDSPVTDSSQITFEVFDPDVLADPHAEYARLRAQPGLVYVPLLDAYAVSRYADVTAVLRDPL